MRYGDCLSLKQAQDAALAILQSEMGLAPEQVESMTLTQSELCWGQIDWLICRQGCAKARSTGLTEISLNAIMTNAAVDKWWSLS